MSPALETIERRRAELGVTRTQLAAAARIPLSYYSGFLIAGRRAPREATVARLNAALDNLRKRRGRGDGSDFALTIAFRLALIVAAHALGHDPLQAQSADPARRATQCPDWMKAAEVRRLALYLLTTECGFTKTAVGEAAGMTKQAVSEACKDLEAIRDEGSAFERMVDMLRDWIMGEPT